MVRVLAALPLILMVAVQPALAGAWMREKGTGFAALSATVYRPDGVWNHQASAYLEWGISPRLTVGLDVNEARYQTGQALLFARTPLFKTERGSRAAVEFGAGVHAVLPSNAYLQVDPMYKLTLSYGRPFKAGARFGWLAMDTAAEYRQGLGHLLKLDATAGLSSGRRFNPILQVETAYTDTGTFLWSVTPGLVIGKAGKQRLLVGIERRSAYPEAYGLKLGIWREF